VHSLTKLFSTGLLLFAFCFDASQQAICQGRVGLIGVGIQLSTPPPFVYNPNYGAMGYFGPYVATPSLGSLEMPPDILLSTWITDQIAVEPSVGLMAYTNETQWRLGITIVNHFGNEKLEPFVLVRAKAYLINSGSHLKDNSTATNVSNYVFGLGVGGEYFIGDKFSVSGECQLNYFIPDKNGLIYITNNVISTGVGISCRFYLH